MPAALINRVQLPHTMSGHQISHFPSFTTLVAGAGNGVKFNWVADSLVVLHNDTGGSATFTIKSLVPAPYTQYGAAFTHPTRVVANGAQVMLRLDEIFKDAAGQVTIECTVAGKVKVLAP